MAITVKWAPLTLEKMIEQVGNDVNLLTGTVKLSLHTSTYVPAIDTDDFFNDATNELAGGTGYTAGGETLTAKTITYDSASDQVRFDFADVTWTFTASKTWRIGVVYIDTAGAASTDPIVAWLTWDSDQTVSTAYTLQIDPAGLLYIDAT
ncbi:MAG: hypothetical protein M3540_11490 [Actinomycetota bacterium]|nr:hypothetical protein [Actinomycetota bacterium]